ARGVAELRLRPRPVGDASLRLPSHEPPPPRGERGLVPPPGARAARRSRPGAGARRGDAARGRLRGAALLAASPARRARGVGLGPPGPPLRPLLAGDRPRPPARRALGGLGQAALDLGGHRLFRPRAALQALRRDAPLGAPPPRRLPAGAA